MGLAGHTSVHVSGLETSFDSFVDFYWFGRMPGVLWSKHMFKATEVGILDHLD